MWTFDSDRKTAINRGKDIRLSIHSMEGGFAVFSCKISVVEFSKQESVCFSTEETAIKELERLVTESSISLGVEAPKEVPVHRREVYDAIKRSEALSKETTP